MRLKLRSSWVATAPAAYTWFLSNRRSRQARPMVYGASLVNPANSFPSFLGVNQRFWQPRLAPQSQRTRLFVLFGVLGGLLFLLVKTVGVAFTQVLNTPDLLYTFSVLAQAPLLWCGVFVLAFLQRWLSALAYFGAYVVSVYSNTPTHVAKKRAPRDKGLDQALTLGLTPNFNHVLLTQAAFKLAKSSALLELRPLPASSLTLANVGLTHFTATPTLLWTRLSQITGVVTPTSWANFSYQCANRAVTARLLAAGWARQAEALRGAPSSWALRYPLVNQLQSSEARAMPVRVVNAIKQTKKANGMCTVPALNTQAFASFYTSASMLNVEPALTYVQTPLFWAPIKAIKINWE